MNTRISTKVISVGGADVRISRGSSPHDDSFALEYRDTVVTITLREAQFAHRQGLDPDTVVVLIDTTGPDTGHAAPIAVYLDDDLLVDTNA